MKNRGKIAEALGRRLCAGAMIAVLGIISGVVKAENRWNVYAGGGIAHLCEESAVGSGTSNGYGWGGHAFLGAGYEIGLGSHWSLTPQLGLNFSDNGAVLSEDKHGVYGSRVNWREYLSVDIPVIVSYRFPVSERVGLRIGCGPSLQECVYGRRYKDGSDARERMSGTFANRFNIGVAGEAGVDTGRHLSYFFRMQYPFLKEGWVRKTITLSIGVRYSF